MRGNVNSRTIVGRIVAFLTLIVAGCLATAQTQQGAPIVANSSNASGQSTSMVFIDTSKIVSTPNTVDKHIAACLLISNKCDASLETSPATTISSTISISQSGVTLILGNLTAPNGTTALLSVSGNGNTIQCAQNRTTLLDASAYSSGSSTPAVSISGNNNQLLGCNLVGPISMRLHRKHWAIAL